MGDGYQVPPEWFRDEIVTLIARGDITDVDGIATMLFPPDWAYGEKPSGAGTLAPTPTPGQTCAGCLTEYAEDRFYISPSGKRHNLCRPCSAKRKREKRKSMSTQESDAVKEYDRQRKRKNLVAA